MIRGQIKEIADKIELKNTKSVETAINFRINSPVEEELFHIQIKEEEAILLDGLAETALGSITAKEDTIRSLMDMGYNLIESLLNLDIPDELDTFEFPQIDTTLSIESKTPDGNPLNFFISVENKQLNIVETAEEEGEIRIKIKSSFLPDLISGDFNLPMALLTGKIKIKNKRELIQLLAKFGLKF